MESVGALRLSQAARALGIQTRDVARLVYERRINFVMLDGIAHIPPEAIEETRGRGH
jgi:hypothetical protein